MKLTKKKVRYLIRHKKRGRLSKVIGIEIKVSKRRVNLKLRQPLKRNPC